MLTTVWSNIGERYGPHQKRLTVKWHLATQITLSAAHVSKELQYIYCVPLFAGSAPQSVNHTPRVGVSSGWCEMLFPFR